MDEQHEQRVATSAMERARTATTGETRSILVSFLELLFGRWLLIVVIFFSAAFWSYMAVVKAPETYEATGQVLIRRGRMQAVRSEPILRQQEDVGSEMDLLVSIAVLEETIRRLLDAAEAGLNTDFAHERLIFGAFESSSPNIAISSEDLPTTDAAQLFKYLKKRIRATKFGESNVIEVSLVSVSPRFAAAAVNTLIDVYEKYQLTVDQSVGQTEFFANEIAKVDAEIDALQMQLVEYKKSRKVANTDKELELLTLRRHALERELDDLQVDKAALETDLDSSSDAGTGNGRYPPFIRQDFSVQRLRQILFIKQAELAELRTQLQATHPSVVAKQEEVDALNERLATEEELTILQQQHVFQQILDKETEITQKIVGIDSLISKYPVMQAEMDRLDRDIKQRTIKRVDLVEQMFKSTTLGSTDASLNKVRVLGYAPLPTLPREERKGFKFAVALLLSLMTAIIAAIFVESLDHSIRRREEIEQQLHVPYLASISNHYR
jgi:uncharacterized protein involved in exopolysaccharide biosynthesis